jgi:hypothetical protein
MGVRHPARIALRRGDIAGILETIITGKITRRDELEGNAAEILEKRFMWGHARTPVGPYAYRNIIIMVVP